MAPGKEEEQPWWLDIEKPGPRAALTIIEQPADPAATVTKADPTEIELPTWRAELVVILQPLGSLGSR